MVSSLSNLVYNLAEEINKIKCKHCNCFLKYESINDNLILSCNKGYSNKLDEKLKINSKTHLSSLTMMPIHLFCY